MSRSKQLIQDIPSGVHLVVILPLKREDYNPETPSIKITFLNNDNLSFEREYLLNEDSIHEFDKMTIMAQIDREKDILKEASSSRLYIAVKETITMQDGEKVGESVKSIVDYMIYEPNMDTPTTKKELIEYKEIKPKQKPQLSEEKKKALAEGREIIKNIEQGIKPVQLEVEPKNNWDEF